MTEKEKLLLALKSALDLEEDFIVRLAPLYQDFLRCSEPSGKEKNEVENILSVLQSDSVKHKKIVENLINPLFEKFEDVFVIEHKAAQIYEECLGLTEDNKVISELSKIVEDEIRHGRMARRLLEITQG